MTQCKAWRCLVTLWALWKVQIRKTAYKRISDETICGTCSAREAASEQSSRDKSCRTLSSSKTVSCQSVWNMMSKIESSSRVLLCGIPCGHIILVKTIGGTLPTVYLQGTQLWWEQYQTFFLLFFNKTKTNKKHTHPRLLINVIMLRKCAQNCQQTLLLIHLCNSKYQW